MLKADLFAGAGSLSEAAAGYLSITAGRIISKALASFFRAHQTSAAAGVRGHFGAPCCVASLPAPP